jgi:hypothetical protein
MSFVTGHMGLYGWNQQTDLFDHTQLANNWAKVDYHDHTPGRGVQIPTDGIEDRAITPAKLDLSVDPSAAYGTYRLVAERSGLMTGGSTSQTYILNTSGANVTALGTAWAVGAMFYMDPNDWVAAGRQVKLRQRASVVTNAVNPTQNFTFRIARVAAWGGASGSGATPTSLTLIGGSTLLISNPGATGTAVDAVEFVAPVAGWYLSVCAPDATIAAGAHTTLWAGIYMRQV